MAYVPPRRITSTPTTITVSSPPSVAWLPDKGYWSTPSNPVSGAKPASLNTASSQMGNFPNFPSGRFFESLWTDYSGAVWNPHIGTYGAMLFHGGGHMAGQNAMADNGVYMWRADTRQWSRLADVSYPGEVTDNDWFGSVKPYSPLYATPSGEVATGVPAANHSRSVPCILSPAWSGSQGALCLPVCRSIGNIGDQASNFPHELDCDLALQVGSAAAGQPGGGWSRIGTNFTSNGTAMSATADNSRGYLYIPFGNINELHRFNIQTNTWSNVSPSGWFSTFGGTAWAIEHAPSIDCLLFMNTSFDIIVIPAGGSPLVATKKTPTGTKPTLGPDESDTSGCGFVWCPDLPHPTVPGVFGAMVTLQMSDLVSGPMTRCQVSACYAPADPVNGTWEWRQLAQNNMPTGLWDSRASYYNNKLWYKRFQYAPALKSFFLCSMPNDSYGGIACFRPVEIP
jgi:hypothetical protein